MRAGHGMDYFSWLKRPLQASICFRTPPINRIGSVAVNPRINRISAYMVLVVEVVCRESANAAADAPGRERMTLAVAMDRRSRC